MRRTLVLAACMTAAAAVVSGQTKLPAAEAFEKLKALDGEWLDADGVFGEKGKIAVTYRVSGAGNTVIETFPVGTAYEMVTVYHLEGGSLVLTHYCSSNTQPRMTSTGPQGNMLTFNFAGGANIDPAKTSHMHGAELEFISSDEIKGTWHNWNDGKHDHSSSFRITRKR